MTLLVGINPRKTFHTCPPDAYRTTTLCAGRGLLELFEKAFFFKKVARGIKIKVPLIVALNLRALPTNKAFDTNSPKSTSHALIMSERDKVSSLCNWFGGGLGVI